MNATTTKMLAHIIREYRYQQNLSQTDVAKLAGTKQATISAFENHPDSTKLDTLFKILSGLELALIIQPRNKTLKVEETTAVYHDDEIW
ncbi:helix-turn-helix domain-containing protein [Pasteurella sp. PK-2025]|uniref:helix-turn-helix domain-containing protein n=1 Tax=unclassified Pasteurella TaxID=2621516 RepID=UPI003C708554